MTHEEAVKELLDLADDMIVYIDRYFRDKWTMDEQLANLKTVLQSEAKPELTARELAIELVEEEPYLYCEYLILIKALLQKFHITRREAQEDEG